MSNVIEKILSESQNRSFAIDKSSINEEDRTVDLAFSSEYPVERWFGNEILDHSPESVRMGRMEDGAAVLVDHRAGDQVGVVESCSIDSDRRGRVVVRFGKSGRADEIFNDVIDGIRKHVSFGYRVYKVVLESRDGDEETYRAVDWEPYEVSMVAIPADPTVGVGRSQPKEKPNLNREKPIMDPVIEIPAVDVAKIQADARTEELARVREIEGAGAKFNKPELAREFIDGGKSVDDFRSALLGKMEPPKQTATPASQLDLTDEETREYSLMRAINAAASGNWKDAGFERECSLAIADKLGRDARGIYVPLDVQNRAQNVGTAADGGHLKATDHLAGSFIDALREKSLIGQLGARYLPGLTGDVDIPKQIGSSQFYWLGEGEDVADSDLQFGNVVLSPKTVAGSVKMTRRLMKQSAPSIEGLVMADLVAGAALAIDRAAFLGTGANNQPLGILNQTGINTQAIADATGKVPTFEELVAFETALANDLALMGKLSYVTTPTIKGSLKTTPKDSGSGIFLLENGQANGYPVHGTTNLDAGTTVFGNFDDVMIGMWGVLDVMPDTAALAASAGIVLRVFQDVDIAIRHPESFCKTA